jgi:hypothetical protein
MTLPNFLIIGAAKSGTSSLYAYLEQHPEIFMSPIKEPHFFSFDSVSRITSGPGDTISQAITSLDDYKHLFDNVKTEKAIGEASTSYLYRPESVKRIYELIPDVKLIAILRHPAERAFSAYMHVVRDQREVAKNFEQALAMEPMRKQANWDPIWHFTSVGFYYNQLDRYFRFFQKDQIKIFLYDELVNDPSSLLRNIFEFLNVDANFNVDTSIKINVSGKQKSEFIYSLSKTLFNSPNPIRWISRQVIPKRWRYLVTNWIRNLNLKKQQIPYQIREELINLYREDILRLECLINKDLSHWLE